jgi:hypothetical protein
MQDKKLLAFNRGVVSKIGLARIDLDRMAMSAEQQSNFMPRVLGSMMLRPGMEYIDNVFSDANFHRNMPFTFGVDDNVLIEMHHQARGHGRHWQSVFHDFGA